MKRLFIVLSFVLSLTTPPATAGGLAERFKQFDKNGDGKLRPDEYLFKFSDVVEG
ncbi:MAG: hypothetical protein WCJ07_02015 [Verrucomicrobiota bacterium]